VPDAASAGRVDAAARTLGAARGPRCRVAPGPPHGEWTDAAIAALTALSEAPSARVEIEGLQVRLVPTPDTIGTAFDAAAARLQSSLPLGFGLVAAPADGPGDQPAATGTAWVRARLDDSRLSMTGLAPDSATRAALVSYAAARFGADRVEDSISVEEVKAPEGWRAAVLAGIDGLAVLERGESFVRDGRIRIWGATRKALAAREAQAALASVAATGWTGTTRITVDLPARVAALKLGGEPCIEALGAQVAANPIQFDPGSARIDPDSNAVLDALADTLGRCAPLTIAVEGHTDSQGSTAYNNRLSEARAGAVRAALIERGGFDSTLRAVGFGPSQPIADNRTEAGRALNRRIAFRVLEPETTPAAVAEQTQPSDEQRRPAPRPPAARPEIQR
jgi:OOP family OmpA-OmpF porin